MTKEEAYASISDIIVHYPDLSEQVRDYNKHMSYEVSVRDDDWFAPSSTLYIEAGGSRGRFMYRNAITTVDIKLYEHVSENGRMFISFRDLLDYKKLLGM